MKAALFIIPILVLLVGCSQKEDLQSSVELEPAKKAVEREYDTSVRTNRMTRAAFFQQTSPPAPHSGSRQKL